MRAFHFAPLRLGPGSTILPGNWGRIVRRHVIQQGQLATGTSLREAIFEQVRLAQFPHRPSRLDACFCLPDRDEAVRYRSQAAFGLLHEIEIIDPDLPRFEALWLHADIAIGQSGFVQFEEKAGLYWSGDATGLGRELVTRSAIRVVQVLE